MLKVSNKYQVETEIKRILDKLNQPVQRRLITLSEYLQDACYLIQTVEAYCHNIIMEVRLCDYGSPYIAFHWTIVKSYDYDAMQPKFGESIYNYINDETQYYLEDEGEITYSRSSYIKNLKSLLNLVDNA